MQHSSRWVGEDAEQRWRIADGGGAQNEGGDHGEDGRVGADAEGEREDDDECEGRFVEEEPGGEAKIFGEGFRVREECVERG